MWKAVADNLNSLDGFKVDARAIRERYDVTKAHFEAKEKEEKIASGIDPEVTTLDTALEQIIEQERERAKNIEAEHKKTKEDQELVQSIRQEAVETFAETRAKKLDKNEEDTGPSARKKSISSGSETLAYLNEKIEKKTKSKEQELELRKKELELQERPLKIAQDQQNQLLTNLKAQNNQFLAVISSTTGKKIDFVGEETSSFVFNILLTLNSTCTFLFFNNSGAVTERYSLQIGRILGKYL